VSSSDAGIEAARFSWDEGLARLAEPTPMAVARARRRIMEAVADELRRRVGSTFTVAELAAAYPDASSWYLQLAARVAPREPDAWEPAITLDASFGLYARGATDARR
jgi:hypothetical protein